MTNPARTDYVITLAAGCTATASLWPVDDLRWSCSLTDPAGVECWRGEGPWANRDVALAQCCLQAETRWGRIVRCEPKERVDEVSRLRARVAELETVVREVASVSRLVDFGEGFRCPFCIGDLEGEPPRIQHEDDCVWLQARKATGMG